MSRIRVSLRGGPRAMRKAPRRVRRPLARIALLTVVALGLLLAAAASAGARNHWPHHIARAHASIIGGYYPNTGEWPWMALLTYPATGEFCGGAVVAPDRVLTAGHCVAEADGTVPDPASLTVTVGRQNLANTSVGETVSVVRIARHPNFVSRTNNSKDYDVAMLTLAHPVSVATATIGGAQDWGNIATVMGWGETTTGLKSDALIAANMHTFSDQQCLAEWGSDFYSPATMLCAGEATNNRVCSGDSGGPVMVTDDSGATWKLIGVVSYIYTSCQQNSGVFAWAAGPTLRPWILDAIAAPLPPPSAPPPPAPAPVTPPAPQPQAAVLSVNSLWFVMRRSDALNDLRDLVRLRTHRRLQRLAAKCRRTSVHSFSCQVHFRAGANRYRGRFQVREFTDGRQRVWEGQFKGTTSHGRKVRWT